MRRQRKKRRARGIDQSGRVEFAKMEEKWEER